MMKLSIRFLFLASLTIGVNILSMNCPPAFCTAFYAYIGEKTIAGLIAEYVQFWSTQMTIIDNKKQIASCISLDVHLATSIENFKKYALRDIAKQHHTSFHYCRILEKRSEKEADSQALFWDKHHTNNDCLIIQIRSPLPIQLPPPKLSTIHEEADPDDIPA